MTKKYAREFRKKLQALNDEELVARFNKDTGHNGWTSARAVFTAIMHEEFERRNLDYSAIGNKKGLSFKNKVKLIGKKLVLQQNNPIPTIKELQNQVNEIKTRNARVEADKAWETCLTRRLLIAVLTYIVIVLFFATASLPNPLVNAIVPTLGFLLSTLTVPIVKKWWVGRR